MRWCLALVLLAGCASASGDAPADDLGATIDRLVAQPPHDNALWGVIVEEEGKVLYSRNPGIRIMPASNRKIFSAAAIAECTPLDLRISTELFLDGENVVIRGNGDPSFGALRHESLGFTPFLDALRQRGIRRVGDIVIDVSAFDRVTIPYTWKVGNLPYDSAAPVDAIAWRENEPQSGFAAPDAALWTAIEFRDALLLAGISVGGAIRVATAPGAWSERVAVVESPIVFDLLATVLKNSHNLYTEMLYKRIGNGTYSEAEKRERAFLTSIGIDGRDFRFADGSGLSPDDLVTPSAIIRLLRWIDAPERRATWWALLAQPGGEGSLRNRLIDLSPRLRAKTGLISGVRALSGIVVGEGGRRRYFAIVVNHHGEESPIQRIDQITREIAKF